MSVACGDDDAAATDGGMAKDGGGGSSADSGPTRIPRRDASVSTTDPIPICDRGDPLGCGPGQICTIVVRRAPKETEFSVYTGCVEERRPRALGDPCDPDYTAAAPYTAPNVMDEVYIDPCGAGLICAPDRNVRGSATCQPACSSGVLGDAQFGCKSSSALCLSAGSFVEFCRESEACDVATQSGCRSGETCYLRPSGDIKGLLSVCRATPTMPTADGEMCNGFYVCKPGSVCLGPVHLPPTRWELADLRCRPICSGAGSDDDAGVVDADAGPAGACGGGASCAGYSESGLSLSSIPKPPYGQCEQ